SVMSRPAAATAGTINDANPIANALKRYMRDSFHRARAPMTISSVRLESSTVNSTAEPAPNGHDADDEATPRGAHGVARRHRDYWSAPQASKKGSASSRPSTRAPRVHAVSLGSPMVC